MTYKTQFAPEVSQHVHATIWPRFHTRIIEMVAKVARVKVPTREFSQALKSCRFGEQQVQDEIIALVGYCYQYAVEKELFMRFDPSRLAKDITTTDISVDMTMEEVLEAVEENIAKVPGGFFFYLRDRVVVPRLSDLKRVRFSQANADLFTVEINGEKISGTDSTIDIAYDAVITARSKALPKPVEEYAEDCPSEALMKIAALKSAGLTEELEFLQLEKHLDYKEEELLEAKAKKDLKSVEKITSQRAKQKESVRARLLAALETIESLEESLAY